MNRTDALNTLHALVLLSIEVGVTVETLLKTMTQKRIITASEKQAILALG